MKLIEQNPFRMIGIPVNASARDLAANKGKMRLLDVGKEVSFPLDLVGLLPKIVRSNESVAIADRDTNQPQDRVRHALFWFARPTSQLGAMAYENLLSGNVDTALKNFQRCQDWESKLCLSTISLQQGDIKHAINAIASVIDEHCGEFVTAVAGQTYTADATIVRHDFVVALTSEMNAAELYSQLKESGVSGSMLDELRSKAVEVPIAEIEKAIAAAKSIANDDAQEQLEVGKSLKTSTTKQLFALKGLVGSSDIRYSRLADKLANQILQCSINYHNAIDNSTDEPISVTVVDNCLSLAEYALKISVGNLARQRIEKNLEILCEKKSNLPPPEVETEVNAILKALSLFVKQPDKIEHSMTLLKTTKPLLQLMKSKLGENKDIYLQLSTQVVGNALSKVISEVNSASSPNYLFGKLTTKDQMEDVVSRAWKCIRKMQHFDMVDEFKKDRFRPNLRTLRGMCWDLDCGFWWEVMGMVFIVFLITGLIIGAANDAPGIGMAIGAGATLAIMGYSQHEVRV